MPGQAAAWLILAVGSLVFGGWPGIKVKAQPDDQQGQEQEKPALSNDNPLPDINISFCSVFVDPQSEYGTQNR
ncbi:MAG: hypothetical protein FWC60_09105 [Firmicutes bacterium]|nr:hypothetical protein [Bacillota bacterium]